MQWTNLLFFFLFYCLVKPWREGLRILAGALRDNWQHLDEWEQRERDRAVLPSVDTLRAFP